MVKLRVTSHPGLPRIGSQARHSRAWVVEKPVPQWSGKPSHPSGATIAAKSAPQIPQNLAGRGTTFPSNHPHVVSTSCAGSSSKCSCVQELERSHPNSKLTGGHLSPSGPRQVQSAPGPCGSFRWLWPLTQWKGSQPCTHHFSLTGCFEFLPPYLPTTTDSNLELRPHPFPL